MADLSSLLSSTSGSSSSSSSNSQLDQLVNSYLQTRQVELDALTTKKTTLESKSTYINSLRSKFNSIMSQVDNFYSVDNDGVMDTDYLDDAVEKFKAKTVTSSDSEYITATADADAVLSPNNIKINRLATNDTLVTKQVNLKESANVTAGKYTFSLQVIDDDADSDATGDDKYDTIDLNISFSDGETKESALKKIADAINANSDMDITASYLKDTTSTGRLVFTSKTPGKDNQIDFSFLKSDTAQSAGITSLLGLDNINADRSSVATDTNSARFRKSDAASLDSDLEVNGVKVTRSSNEIDDLLPGVTINLLKVQEADDTELTIKTELNTKKIVDTIQPLIDAYNEAITFLKSDNTMLRGDSAVSGLLSQLRSLVSQSIEPATPDAANATDEEIAPRYLTDMGMKIKSDGTISWSDQSVLTDMLSADGGQNRVAYFFTSTDGFSARLHNIISKVTEDDGLLELRTSSYSKQIDGIDDRYDQLQTRIDKQSASLRKQYTSYLESYYESQNQYSTMSSLFS